MVVVSEFFIDFQEPVPRSTATSTRWWLDRGILPCQVPGNDNPAATAFTVLVLHQPTLWTLHILSQAPHRNLENKALAALNQVQLIGGPLDKACRLMLKFRIAIAQYDNNSTEVR